MNVVKKDYDGYIYVKQNKLANSVISYERNVSIATVKPRLKFVEMK